MSIGVTNNYGNYVSYDMMMTGGKQAENADGSKHVVEKYAEDADGSKHVVEKYAEDADGSKHAVEKYAEDADGNKHTDKAAELRTDVNAGVKTDARITTRTTAKSVGLSDYLKGLERLAPSVKFGMGYGLSNSRYGKTLQIHPKILEKMQSNPEMEREMKELIGGVEKAMKISAGIDKALGMKAVYGHWYIDEKGKCWHTALVVKDDAMNKKLREERRINSQKLIQKAKENSIKNKRQLKEIIEKHNKEIAKGNIKETIVESIEEATKENIEATIKETDGEDIEKNSGETIKENKEDKDMSAVRVGESYVSQQAYTYAKAKIDSEKAEGKEKSNVLQELSKQYPDTKFAIGTAPFAGKGTNNISIAPNILRKMENDPEARLEYEALIYDCANLLKNEPTQHGDSKTIARGFIINEDGSLGGWGITQSDGGGKTKENKKVKKDEFNERLDKIKKKKAEEKKQAKKLEEKKKAEKIAEEKAENKDGQNSKAHVTYDKSGAALQETTSFYDESIVSSSLDLKV